MINSMTAFSRQEASDTRGEFTLEIRSVNHRYLEMSLRLPDELRTFEPLLRERASQRLARGKLDINVRYQAPRGSDDELQVDMALVEKLARTSHEVDRLIYNPAPVSPLDLMRWPGVMQSASVDGEALKSALLEVFERGLGDLCATRRREGEKLQATIEQRCSGIEQVVARVEQALPDIRQAWRDKLLNRLGELQAELDANRVEQELVFLAQKTDVEEELDRLKMHVGEVRRVLQQDQPSGRRLDFLMQELNREANTLGSKSVHVDTTNASVDLKVLIEQMREQVQNIE